MNLPDTLGTQAVVERLEDAGDVRREDDEGEGEDERDHAGGVDAQRNVGLPRLSVHAAAPEQAARVLHRHPPLRLVEEDDGRHHHDDQREDHQDADARQACRGAGDAGQELGMPATMPPKMMREMPLPMPFSVMSSPSQTRNMVPAVMATTARASAEARCR